MINSFKLFILLTPFIFTSCASYINRIHRQLDQEEGRSHISEQDNFTQFRNQGQRPGHAPNMHTNFTAPNYRQQLAQRPAAYQSRSTANTSHMSPTVKRDYRPEQEAQKRYRVEDLTDNQNEASLWSGQGKNSNLFGAAEDKRNGDIVLIQVAGRLKNEITLELKRAFPSPISAPAKQDATTTPATDDAATGPAPASASENTNAQDYYDRISSVIVEHINSDHLLLRGRKHVLYKEHKRLIEIQALVARRDIAGDDTVNSDKILESSIVVLR